MTSNFRTHLSHPKPTDYSLEKHLCAMSGLTAFVVARRDEINPNGRRKLRLRGTESRGPEAKGTDRSQLRLKIIEWRILEMGVLKPFGPIACMATL